MENGTDNQSVCVVSDVISVDNTFYPIDVTQRTDGDAQADWERCVHVTTLIAFSYLRIHI